MDDDDVSLTSTQSSLHSDNSEYEIEEIVASKKSDRGQEYLVRWLGYDDSRATWEPAHQFADEYGLKHWDKEHKHVDPEQRQRDIEAIESAIKVRYEASQRRKQRRQQLRTEKSKSNCLAPRPKQEPENSGNDPNNFRKPLKRKRSDQLSPLIEENETPRDKTKRASLPTRSIVRRGSDKTTTKEVPPPTLPTAKRTKSTSQIPKYLSGPQGSFFKNMRTQHRVQKILGAEPTPDRSALKLITADQIDSEMEKAYAQRASDPLGLNSAFETVGDRRRARDALKSRTSVEDAGNSEMKAVTPAFSPISSGPAHLSVSNYGKRTLSNGRYWYQGEILVRLWFDKNLIGDVRFSGLDEISCKSILHMKEGHMVPMNAQDVWDKERYINVCTGKNNQVFSTGHIIGFEDTQPQVKEMANFLHHTKCIALVWHPNKSCVFIFYSILSKEWHFFEDRPVDLPTDQELRVVCRSYFEDLPFATPAKRVEPPNASLASYASNYVPIARQQEPRGIESPERPRLRSREPSRDPRLQPKRVDFEAQNSIQARHKDNVSPTDQGRDEETTASPSLDSSALPLLSHYTDPRLKHGDNNTSHVEQDRTQPIDSRSTNNAPNIPQKAVPKEPQVRSDVQPYETTSPVVDKTQERAMVKQYPTLQRPELHADSKIPHAHNIKLPEREIEKSSESDQVTEMSASEALLDHIYKTSIQWPAIKNSSIDCFAFYLIFPESQKQELKDIENFIDKQSTTTYIFTDSQPTDKTFSRFAMLIKRTANSLGVILMHSTQKDFTAIPQLASLLKGPSQVPSSKAKSLPKLNIFAVSLGQPILELASAGHLQRLFPHQGVCLLVTEATIRKEPSNALAILRWFSAFTKKKVTWKMCLRPRIRHCLAQAVKLERDTYRRQLMSQMLETINHIIADSFVDDTGGFLTPDSNDDTYESIGNDGDTDDEGVSAPLISLDRLQRYGQPPSNPEVSQLTKNEHVLLEWFASWACKKASRHRCFVAITTESLKDWAAWNHIEIITPTNFMEDLGITANSGELKRDRSQKHR